MGKEGARFEVVHQLAFISREVGGGGGERGRSGFFVGKEGASFEVVHQLAFISREVGGWADIKNGARGRVVMAKTIIICVRLSVWAQ